MKIRKVIMYKFILMSCVSWVLLGPVCAQTIIKGKVLDKTGEAIPFAVVSVDSLKMEVSSGVDGEYVLENIPEGTHTITAQTMGYSKHSKKIAIKEGVIKAVSFVLHEDVYNMEEMVISYDKEKTEVEEIRETSYNVGVIDAKKMANKSGDLNQVLSSTPGVRIREEGGLGSDFDFSLNGFNGNQVRFFLDGIPMENFGSSLTLNNLPINVAERIEVYKGVVPVWLGSDALGGAVNVVTNQSKRNYLDVSYTYGSFNTHRSSINTAYTHEKTGVTVRANLFQNYSDNSYKVLVDKRDGAKILDEKEEVKRFHDTYDSKTAILDLGVVDKKYADQLFMGIVLSGSVKDIQTGSTMDKVYGQRALKSSTVMPTFKYKKKDLFTKGLELNAYASYNLGYTQSIDTAAKTYYWDGSYDVRNDPMAGELNRTLYKFSDNAVVVNTNLSYIVSDNHSFVVNYNLNSLNRKGFDEENPDSRSNKEPKLLNKSTIGLGYKFDWKKRLSVTLFAKEYILGGKTHYTINRYTTNERVLRQLNNNYLGYGTALSYKVRRQLQLKASFEKAYRLPEGHELFGDGVNLEENPQLSPEESENFNAGFLVNFKFKEIHKLFFEASYLFRNADNFIRQTVTEPTSIYINEEAVQAHGVEAAVNYSYKNLFQLSGNITYQKLISKDQYFDTGKEKPTYLKQVPNIPYLFANLEASLQFEDVKFKKDKLTLSYGFNFVEEYFLKWSIYGDPDSKLIIPRQISYNTGLTYSLSEGKYNISFECRNLFDARLYDNFKLQKPGRAFYLKLRYFISK